MRAHAALMIFALLLGASAVVLVCGAVYQIIGTLRDRRRFVPPGRLVRFDKRRMHIHVIGEGTPTVVFESGMGASSLSRPTCSGKWRSSHVRQVGSSPETA